MKRSEEKEKAENGMEDQETAQGEEGRIERQRRPTGDKEKEVFVTLVVLE